jgi:hypothetical protein
VLYRGSRPWNAERELTTLIQPGPSALEIYRPQARYLLIEEKRYAAHELDPLRNVVAALFRLENSRTEHEIVEVVGALSECLRSPEQEGLRRAFVEWLERAILVSLPGGPVKEAVDLQEMHTMLEERMQQWAEGHERAGLERGLRQGMQQGLLAGEARILSRQLQKRFGELPEWVRLRLEAASVEQLECWAERLLERQALDAVFDEGAPSAS